MAALRIARTCVATGMGVAGFVSTAAGAPAAAEDEGVTEVAGEANAAAEGAEGASSGSAAADCFGAGGLKRTRFGGALCC